MRAAKFFSLAFFLFIFILQASAQAVSIGISGGSSLANLHFSNDFTDDLFDPTLGFFAGGNVTWRFSKHLGLRTGLAFERKGGQSDVILTDENGNPSGNGTTKELFDFFEMPILLEARFGGKFKGIVQAGQSVGYLVQHTSQIPLAIFGTDQGTTEIHQTDQFNRFEHCIIGGIGLEVNFTEKLAFQFLVRSSYSLTTLEGDSVRFRGVEMRNTTVAGTIGLQLFLK